MNKILYVDGASSTGKSKAAIHECIRRAKLGQKLAFILPSKESIDEIHRRMLDVKSNIKITRIDSTTNPKEVRKSITAVLKNAEVDKGEVLFITHMAFLGMPYWDRRHIWHLIVDEIPSPFEDLSKTLPHTHNIITDHCTFKQISDSYVMCSPSEEGKTFLKKIAINKDKDDGYEVYRRLAECIVSDHYNVYFEEVNLNRTIKKIKNDQGHEHMLLAWSLLQPSIFDGFASTTIMGAMFKESLLYLMWSEKGVVFSPSIMQKKLRTNEIGAGRNIAIEYLSERDWSKNLRDATIKQNEESKKFYDVAFDNINQQLNDEKCLFIRNKDRSEDLPENGVQAPVICHGLNKFDTINNVAFLCALNPTPATFRFMRNQNINPNELRRAGYLQTLYQGVMRTSLRRPDITDPVRIIVPDRQAADYLKVIFKDAVVKQLIGMPEMKTSLRRRIWRDATARKQGLQRKYNFLNNLREMNVDVPKTTIIPHIYSRDLISSELTTNKILIDQLREAYNETTTKKTDNVLICPSTFGRKTKNTVRASANVSTISGVWFDIENGEMTPEDFRGIFPNLWFVACSTFSNDMPGKGQRYRLVIPTKNPMTPEVDELIKKMIMAKLHENGWAKSINKNNEIDDTSCKTGPIHTSDYTIRSGMHKIPRNTGIDRSKLAPSSFFYMPIRRVDDTKAFFIEYAGDELDVELWLSGAPASLFDVEESFVEIAENLPETPLASNTKTKVTKQDRVIRAIAVYQQVPVGADKRYSAFMALGRKLQLAGCSRFEIETILIQNAIDTKIRKRIPGIMKTLATTSLRARSWQH